MIQYFFCHFFIADTLIALFIKKFQENTTVLPQLSIPHLFGIRLPVQWIKNQTIKCNFYKVLLKASQLPLQPHKALLTLYWYRTI